MKTRITPLMLAVAIVIGSTVPMFTASAAADPSPTGRDTETAVDS